ncbi:FecCD family ABC transporter permease [Halocatena salina]|uniref:Cobalamin import system permease protein BtuC n=1 Tax=Halocatena salina TaxID=2934340 RepID=A0A8U0A1X6_9EURY|nr:iron ABC transporter permease [Halocatena salina]UPM42866.1 iron ABC transporter permease [Halocatena salina]
MNESESSVAQSRSDSEPLQWLFDPSLLGLCGMSVLLVIAGGLIQVSFGAYQMSIKEAWQAVFNPAVLFDLRWLFKFTLGESLMRSITGFTGTLPSLDTSTTVVWNIRLPRVLLAVFVGMNLAVSGAIFQAVTRNELASPFVLGISHGAGLVILLTLVVFTGLTALLPIVAALGGAVAFAIVYAIAWKNGTSPVRLVLAGIIVATVFQSLQRALFFFATDIGTAQTAMAWMTGSLTGVGWTQFRMALPWTILVAGLSIVSARQLNVLLLGQRTAKSLGMSVERVRFALSGVAVLAAAVSIAVAGVVSFVGLIVPHLVRTIVGNDHKKLIVGCLFAGPALMVIADVGARLGLPILAGATNQQLPVGVVTGLIGGPYFLYLMRKRRQLGDV